MKYAKMFALTLTMLPLLATAQLASNERIAATVPFQFMVGNKVVPAGNCVVQSANSGGALIISNHDAKVAMFASTLRDEISPAPANYSMVFHKIGDRYFLSEIKLAGDRTTYKLPQSKLEAELLAQNLPVTNQVLLASLK